MTRPDMRQSADLSIVEVRRAGFSTWLRPIIAATLVATGASAAFACGGTTGREGLPASGTATDASMTTDRPVGEIGAMGTTEADATIVDASVADDAQDIGALTFDVAIQYADRLVPDVSAPPDAGLEAGTPWPDCPRFIGLDQSGRPTPTILNELLEIPAAIDDGGIAVRAPADSPCATYPWLGSIAADVCLLGTVVPALDGGCTVVQQRSAVANECLVPGNPDSTGMYISLPPCNWALEAGAAVRGPGANTSRYSLCMALYTCMMRTGCAAAKVTATATCLCGATSNNAECQKDAAGPCAAEEFGALEEPANAMGVADGLSNYLATGGFPGVAGSILNVVFDSARGAHCITLDAGRD